ncbi:radical SAM protein [Kitasatospora sp. YST-16]|uniref:radical SAM/SPASM domain-containing protein n=1 Tax=Kitasatospora sp. YST-16 TaxID=2998080 RepID=UPI002283418D|nr:radical SAM protein [Kitasatospora sp. YST-16]WAL73139.1 radical SAM protein [Kitasatospora sp. YST-16]WNW39193.1 radical SAM protein [Streptomyces sp. Li-HN-5-13]
MTALMELPQSRVLNVPHSAELELTNTCQLRCDHCFNNSGPEVPHGTMTLDDWKTVITECAELGIRAVQLIGGEPTAFPGWRDLVDHALSLEREVEVFSNLFHITGKGWETLSRPGVRLATSYYSVNAGEHDRVTNKPGSHAKTRANIVKAIESGIPIRAGVVRCHDGQLEELAVHELRALGVQAITLDDARGVGRASNGQPPTMNALCGNCARGRLAILPDGTVAPCVIGRWLEGGNVKDPGGLRAVLESPQWAKVAASIPPKATMKGCPPNDSNDCSPANTEACGPAYGFAPVSLGGCPPNDSDGCSPGYSPPKCVPQFSAVPVLLGGCPPNDSNDCSPANTEACAPKY